MKKLFAALIFLLLLVGRADAAFYANYFTTNANPVAGGGGIVSNAVYVDIRASTRYTNSTPYYAAVSSAVGITIGSGATKNASWVFLVDTNLDGTYDYPQWQTLGVTATLPADTTFYSVTAGGLVPPYAAFRYEPATAGGATTSFTSSNSIITYFGTNSSSGGGSGTTYTNDTGLPGVVSGSSIGTNLASLMIKTNPVGYFGSTYELSTNRIPYWQGASYVNSSYTLLDSWNNGILTVFAKINGAGGYDYYWGSLTNQAQVFQVSDTPRDGNEPRVGFNYNYDSGDFEGDLHYQWVWRTNSGLYYIGELSTFFNYMRYRASDGDFSFGVSNQSLTLTATNVIGTNYTGYGTTTLADLNVTGTMTSAVVRATSIYPLSATNSYLYADATGRMVGTNNGAGLTNLNPAAIAYATNAFISASNTLTLANNYTVFQASTAVSITNVAGINSAESRWQTLIISNSLATSITGYCTVPTARLIGMATTNALTIPAGKVGVWSFLTFGNTITNYANAVQQ